MSELRVGQRVYDRWFSHWGEGIVRAVMKTRVKIEFFYVGWREDRNMTYDKAHCQFLELC